MPVLETLAISILPTLARASASEFIDNEEVLKWVATAGALIARGIGSENELAALAAMIERMVEEQRNPTEDEWLSLRNESDALAEAIKAWRPGQA